MSMQQFRPGDVLPNGATVVKHEYDVVLAVWKDHEYVTWRIDEKGNAYWGHYFPQDLAKAAVEFQERVTGRVRAFDNQYA